MSVSGDHAQDKIWIVFGAVSHLCIHWSIILACVSSCEVMRASIDLTVTDIASVIVK